MSNLFTALVRFIETARPGLLIVFGIALGGLSTVIVLAAAVSLPGAMASSPAGALEVLPHVHMQPGFDGSSSGSGGFFGLVLLVGTVAASTVLSLAALVLIVAGLIRLAIAAIKQPAPQH